MVLILWFSNFSFTWVLVAHVYFRYLLYMPAEVYEEILEIVSYMTFFSPTISLDMWSLWPLLMEALADWAIDFFPSTVMNYFLTTIYLNFSLLYKSQVHSLDHFLMDFCYMLIT